MKATNALSNRVVSNVDLYHFTLHERFFIKTMCLLPNHIQRSSMITISFSFSKTCLFVGSKSSFGWVSKENLWKQLKLFLFYKLVIQLTASKHQQKMNELMPTKGYDHVTS